MVLPRALSYNAPAVPQAMQTIAEALPSGDGDAGKGLDTLIKALSLPTSLSEFGMQEKDVDTVVGQVMHSAYANPMPLEPDKIRQLINSCYGGAKAAL